MINAKESYRQWLTQENLETPLFLQPFWLDAVCGEDWKWNVALVQTNDGKPLGAMPYVMKSVLGQRLLKMPPLTPFLGPVLFYPADLQKNAAIYAFEKKVMSQLIDQLPSFLFFSERFLPSASTNALPFLWKGFRVATYYTYIISSTSEEAAWKQMDAVNRKIIRRASSEFRVESCQNPVVLYDLLIRSYALQKKKPPFSLTVLQAVDEALRRKESRQILLARSKDDRVLAGLYLAWDDRTLYTLAIARNGSLYREGAYELLLWEAIKLSVTMGKELNFCGSSTARFERKLRLFGGQLTPYHYLTKTPNRLLEALRILLQRS